GLGNRDELLGRALVGGCGGWISTRGGMTAISPAVASAVVLSIPLDTGWEVASAGEPAESKNLGNLRFIPARVPGTVASELREQGMWRMGAGVSFDAAEHWFRCRFEAAPLEAGEQVVLR